MVRKTVYELVDLWAKWGVFSQLMCQNLRYMFTSAYQQEIMMGDGSFSTSQQEEHDKNFDGEPIDFEKYWNTSFVDDHVDGDPIVTKQ